ncbi:hypothetical protein [Slackia piriformis]|uniref:hypothetical protein n=1 Tax=Slackia piriformis TaxID=626934 RepID=UPI0023F393F6|nr:hypothetical protein [Slackia piriformis]
MEDTRQQTSQHVEKNAYWKSVGQHVVRSKLIAGDYMFVGGTVSVDTKRSILELASNIDQQHDRFRRELVNARECGIELHFLVENADGVRDLPTLARWQNPRRFVNAKRGLRPPIDGRRMAKACATMEERYGCFFHFCTPEEAGARVLEILGKEAADGGNPG